MMLFILKLSLFCMKGVIHEGFLLSMSFVVLSEMGEKTQLLAMAFATRYKATTVLWVVFWATLLNHLLAVVVGAYLTNFIPIQYIQIAAAVSFILFGLWTIRGNKLNNEDKRFSSIEIWFWLLPFTYYNRCILIMKRQLGSSRRI
jgi:putative Ca2+/H+ antiporter (TMEM165/GDT1 family)